VRGAAVGWCTELQAGRSRVRFPMSLEYFIDIIHKEKNPTRCNNVSKFYYSILYEAQHVSGDTPPIIRSLKLYWQPLVFHTWKIVGRVVGGRVRQSKCKSCWIFLYELYYDARIHEHQVHWHPSGHTMALGLTQLLIEMSTRNSSCGGKDGRCVGLTTLPPSCVDCLEIWEPQPPGTLRACPGL